MISRLEAIKPFIGQTPLKELDLDNVKLFAKLEYTNLTGSIKDRPAYRILWEALSEKKIDSNTTIIESSSGNFAIALSIMCRNLGIKFIAVIDPVINQEYEKLLCLLCYKVIKVTEIDETGGYLLNRIKVVKEYCEQHENVFWPNQYDNYYNYLSYYEGLSLEVHRSFPKLDYIFVGVSSGGTITGLSLRLKELYPSIKVIGVDVEGSVIFGGKPQKRFISGLGASKSSSILSNAKIDEVVIIPQMAIVTGCEELLNEQVIFGGGSSGAVYYAIKQYFADKYIHDKPIVLFMCPDKGTAYMNTIYKENWLKEQIEMYKESANA